MMIVPCYVFDIDGTIADLTHRLHHIQKEPKDWDSFFSDCHKDAPITHVRHLLQDPSKAGAKIVYVSGRSSQVRSETAAWLLGHLFPAGQLYMRTEGDHRPDNLVKGDLLDELHDAGFRPIMAFDDRNQVVEMWRAKGVPCAQVAPGDF